MDINGLGLSGCEVGGAPRIPCVCGAVCGALPNKPAAGGADVVDTLDTMTGAPTLLPGGMRGTGWDTGGRGPAEGGWDMPGPPRGMTLGGPNTNPPITETQ